MITEAKIKKIQAKLNKAIAEISKEENVSIVFGGIRYNSAEYSTTMKVKTLEKSEKVTNLNTSVCKRYGFTQNILGMTFEGKNGTMKIIDIKTRNRSYPIIAECLQNGKSYKYSATDIKQRLGGDKIINRNVNLTKLLG